MSIVFRKLPPVATHIRRCVASAQPGVPSSPVNSRAFDAGPRVAAAGSTAAVVNSCSMNRFQSMSVLEVIRGIVRDPKRVAVCGRKAAARIAIAPGVARITSIVRALQLGMRELPQIILQLDWVMCIEPADNIPVQLSRMPVQSKFPHAPGFVLFTATPSRIPFDSHLNGRRRTSLDRPLGEVGSIPKSTRAGGSRGLAAWWASPAGSRIRS